MKKQIPQLVHGSATCVLLPRACRLRSTLLGAARGASRGGRGGALNAPEQGNAGVAALVGAHAAAETRAGSGSAAQSAPRRRGRLGGALPHNGAP